jgi:hypothetical protein
MKKMAYIFMVFDTLEEYHVEKALESFDLQDKSYIDTFILYNNSTTFSTEWIRSMIKGVDKIEVIDKNLPTDKKMVSDVNYQLNNIKGYDIYLLHKSDFYLPSNSVKSVYEKFNDSEPKFINFGKFDMREDIRGEIINNLDLPNKNLFTEVTELSIASSTFHNITLEDRMIGYQGNDGTTHAYNEEARGKLKFKGFITGDDWRHNQQNVKMICGDDSVFAYHMWHDIGVKTDNKQLGKNIIGHRF